MNYTLGHIPQPLVTDMSKRKPTTDQVVAGVLRLQQEHPVEFPKGISKWERKALEILMKPDPERDRKIGDAILDIAAESRPSVHGQHHKVKTCEHP